MSDRLPEFIDPLLFAEKERSISGQLKLSSLQRLSAILADDRGLVQFALSFGMDGKIARLHGTLKTVLHLQCCNCLEKIIWPINGEFILGIVSTSNEIDLLPDNYEPLIVEESKITLAEIIEDELLLSIPAFPRHELDCISWQQKNSTPIHKTEESSPNNPFSILAKLKNTGEK